MLWACEYVRCGRRGQLRIWVDAGPLGRFSAWSCEQHATQPVNMPEARPNAGAAGC